MKSLPKKLSDRILLALTDLEACERDPNYRIDMNTFHLYINNKCHVCLAGSVMAKTLGAPLKSMSTNDFGPKLKRQLYELDSVRLAHIRDWFAKHDAYTVARFANHNRSEWLPYMLDIVGRLQSEGL